MSKRFLGIFLPEEFFSSENLRPDRQEFKPKSTHFWNNLTVMTHNLWGIVLSWWFSEKTLETANSEFNYRLFLKGLDLVRRWETKLVCDQYKSRINFRNNISFVPFLISYLTNRNCSHSVTFQLKFRRLFLTIRDPRTTRSELAMLRWKVHCFNRFLFILTRIFRSNLTSIRLGPG